MPQTKDLGGKILLLNGEGIRTKTIFNVKVYRAGLYLEKKSNNANEILSTNNTKQLVMQFLHKVPKEKLVEAWSEGFENNCKLNCQNKGALSQLNQMMVDMTPGDQISLTFSKEGVDIKINSEPSKRILDEKFSKDLLSIWLGTKPPTDDLKRQLLGTQPSG